MTKQKHYQILLLQSEKKEIPRNRKSFKPIKGIRTIHRVETKNTQTVLLRTVSCYCDGCLEGYQCLFLDQVGISLEVKIEAEDFNLEDETLEDDSYETVADMINTGQIFAVLCNEENDFFLLKATSGSHMLTGEETDEWVRLFLKEHL